MCFKVDSSTAVGKWGRTSVASSFGDLKPFQADVSHSLAVGC